MLPDVREKVNGIVQAGHGFNEIQTEDDYAQ